MCRSWAQHWGEGLLHRNRSNDQAGWWRKVLAMKLILWVAAVLMLVSAVMLIAGYGASGLWISVITVGIAVVAIDLYRDRHSSVH
jgi:hypothetical protein